MADEEIEERRDEPRLLTDLDLKLVEPGGASVDDSARAIDISPEGFKIVSRSKLKAGAQLRFVLTMKEGSPVTGEIELVWARADEWGGTEAGARVLHMSWGDARRLKSSVYTPGYDFTRWAWLTAKFVFLLVIVVGTQQIFFNEPAVRQALLDALPPVAIAVAALVIVISIFRG